jgi:hypothetical protein
LSATACGTKKTPLSQNEMKLSDPGAAILRRFTTTLATTSGSLPLSTTLKDSSRPLAKVKNSPTEHPSPAGFSRGWSLGALKNAKTRFKSALTQLLGNDTSHLQLGEPRE